MIRFDTSEVEEVAALLAKAPGVAIVDARKVVARGSLNIKRDAQRLSSGLSHAPAYPRSITYDTVETSPTVASGEIGPDKNRRQGALGNILEFGTKNNGPTPHMRPAAKQEQPRFERAMEDLAAKATGL